MRSALQAVLSAFALSAPATQPYNERAAPTKSIAIIGGGSSGLGALKVLLDVKVSIVLLPSPPSVTWLTCLPIQPRKRQVLAGILCCLSSGMILEEYGEFFRLKRMDLF